jgi:hypothetical protein
MELLWAKNTSAEGAKQHSPGRKLREKRGGETSPERAAQFFRFLTTCVAPTGLQLRQFLSQGFTLRFAVSRFQRYPHAQPVVT